MLPLKKYIFLRALACHILEPPLTHLADLGREVLESGLILCVAVYSLLGACSVTVAFLLGPGDIRVGEPGPRHATSLPHPHGDQPQHSALACSTSNHNRGRWWWCWDAAWPPLLPDLWIQGPRRVTAAETPTHPHRGEALPVPCLQLFLHPKQ